MKTSPLRLATSIFLQLNTCGHSPSVTSSLMREWVCHLHLSLAFNSAVILRSELAGHTTFHSIGLETPLTWRAKSPYLYAPGPGWSSYTPRHWLPFSSPPTTRRAMVTAFDPTSTWLSKNVPSATNIRVIEQLFDPSFYMLCVQYQKKVGD
jgi:hypothetical protein